MSTSPLQFFLQRLILLLCFIQPSTYGFEPRAVTLVFSDGTRVDLKENTRLTIKQVDLSQLFAEGKSDKPIGRTIKLLAGDIFSEIAKNPEIATEFETPSGVAAVKGTRISLSVSPTA